MRGGLTVFKEAGGIDGVFEVLLKGGDDGRWDGGSALLGSGRGHGGLWKGGWDGGGR